MRKNKITAVIPIRKGSQRVIRKNVRSFAGTSLLQLKIESLKRANLFDDIVVNTDCEQSIEIAKANGISFHRRDPYYASSECSGSDFFEHLGLVTDTEVLAYCPVTSPFISVNTIEKCIREFNNRSDIDTVATVSSVKEFLWLNDEPLNYQRENAPNSQNLPDVVALNFGFTLSTRESVIRNKNIVGLKPYFVVTSDIETIDIDTPLDFYIAESIYLKTIVNKAELLD